MSEETPFTAKAIQKALKVEEDGLWGAQTENAAREFLGFPKDNTGRPWGRKRLVLGVQQKLMRDAGIVIDVDGLFGEKTMAAFERYRSLPPDLDKAHVVEAGMDFDLFQKFWAWWQGPRPAVVDKVVERVGAPPVTVKAEAPKPVELPPVVVTQAPDDYLKGLKKNNWPTQALVPTFYGNMGQNQVIVECPWQMELSWDPSSKTHRISLHQAVAPSAQRALKAIYEHYGNDGVRKLGLHKYGGSLNVRKMRGSNAWSMHSWGIAIDWDPDNNQLSWDHERAKLAKAEAEAFWKIWEAEGWVSLGRERDYDWMHVQAARL